jgi:hypothetical protein
MTANRGTNVPYPQGARRQRAHPARLKAAADQPALFGSFATNVYSIASCASARRPSFSHSWANSVHVTLTLESGADRALSCASLTFARHSSPLIMRLIYRCAGWKQASG